MSELFLILRNSVVRVVGGWSVSFFTVVRGNVELNLRYAEYSWDRFIEEYEVIPRSEVEVKQETMILRGDEISHEARIHLYRDGVWYERKG
jgi:hypothetical protein